MLVSARRVGKAGLIKRDELRAMLGDDDGYDSEREADEDLMDQMAMNGFPFMNPGAEDDEEGEFDLGGMPMNAMMMQALMMQMMAAQQGHH